MIEGLPVANGDHAAGAHTNIGLSKNKRVAGVRGSHIFLVMLYLRITKAWIQREEFLHYAVFKWTAKQANGYNDVALYATKVHNTFLMSPSQRGIIYAEDIGLNKKFGDAATLCITFVESKASKGRYVKNTTCGGGVFINKLIFDNRFDKNVKGKDGKLYGQPNSQRSATSCAHECL